MAKLNNSLIRIRVIDNLLSRNTFPSKKDIISRILERVPNITSLSNNSIEKDLLVMKREFDAPIKYSKSRDGYYYSEPGFSLSNAPLSQDEKANLQMAGEVFELYKNNNELGSVGFSIEKMQSNLLNDPENSVIQFEEAPGTKGGEFLRDLIIAAQTKRKVSFIYQSFQSKDGKKRTVLPLLLKEYRNRWYLLCYESKKKGIRTFALDRMSELTIIQEFVTEEIDFDKDHYFKYTTGITVTEDTPVVVEIWTDKIASKYIESQPLHHSQTRITEAGTRVKFKYTLLVTEELIRTLLSFGSEIEVTKPESLRLELKNRINRMVDNYH